MPVEQFVPRLQQHLFRQGSRAGAEVPDPTHHSSPAGLARCVAGRLAGAFGLGFDLADRFNDLFQPGQLLAVIERNQRDALRRPAHAANLGDAGTDQHAAGGDQHDFVFVIDQLGADDDAVALAVGDGAHALGAATGMAEIGEHGALAEAVFGRHQHRLLIAFGDQQGNHRLPRLQAHAAHATGAATHRPDIFLVEPDRLAGIRNQHDVAAAVGQLDADQVIALVQRHGDDAGLARVGEIGERRLLDRAHDGRHEDVLVVGEFLDRQHGIDPFAFFQREEIDDRLAAADPAALRRFVNLEPVAAAAVGEAQDVIVRVGDEQLVDEILVLDRRRLLAAPAAPLGAVIGQRLGLDVAAVRERHHHVLRRDEVFDTEFLRVQHDFGTALVAELVADGRQFADDDFGDALRTGQDVEQVEDLGHHVLVFADDLVLLETGQALQAQFENGLRLGVRQAIALVGEAEFRRQAVRARRVGSGADQHFLDHRAAPGALHQAALGIGRRRRRLDQGDDFIDVGQRDRQAFQDVAALARLAQFEHGAPRHHFAAMRQEAFEHLLQVQQARLAIDQRHHVHAEGVLQLRLLVQVVEDDLGHLAALQLDDDAHAGLVRLVADIGDALDLLLVDQLGDLFDQGLLVNLVGNLVDDDGLTIALVHVLDMRAAAHDDAPAAGPVAFANAHDAVDQRGGREIGGGNVFDQFVNRQRRVFQQGQTTGDRLRSGCAAECWSPCRPRCRTNR